MKNVAVRNVRTGAESPADLEKVRNLQARLEAIRLQAGGPIDLGHVVNKTVPRMVAPLRSRGALSTRTSIPNPHLSLGVFGAVSAASARVLPGSVTVGGATVEARQGEARLAVEHPTGLVTVETNLETSPEGRRLRRSALPRTARAHAGAVLVPGSARAGAS